MIRKSLVVLLLAVAFSVAPDGRAPGQVAAEDARYYVYYYKSPTAAALYSAGVYSTRVAANARVVNLNGQLAGSGGAAFVSTRKIR